MLPCLGWVAQCKSAQIMLQLPRSALLDKYTWHVKANTAYSCCSIQQGGQLLVLVQGSGTPVHLSSTHCDCRLP